MNVGHRVECSCGAPRRTVTDFFLNTCRRTVAELPWPHSELEYAHDGAFVQFAVCIDGSVVSDAQYRATTCAALVAYAELLAEQTVGLHTADALRLTPATLVEQLSGVPAYKHERATMVVQALWSAVARTVATEPRVQVRPTR